MIQKKTTENMESEGKFKSKQRVFTFEKLNQIWVKITIAFLSVLFIQKISIVNANNIKELNFNCMPCTMFGGYYCYDDPWKVVQKADYCFENAVDKIQCTGNFSNNFDNCTVYADQLQPWGECEYVK